MRCKCGKGAEPVTGKMPVPQVLLLKDQHYSINSKWKEEDLHTPRK